MKARILVVKGEPEYQILHEFAEAFTKALEGVGCIVQYADLLEKFDENRIDKQIDAVVSFGGVGHDFIRKITDAPFFCYLVEHPSRKHLDFSKYSLNDYVLCVDRNHAKYINTYYHNIGGAFFLPFGGTKAQDAIPYSDKTVQVLFSGDYYSSESVLKQMQDVLQPFEQKIAFVLISKMQSKNITLEDALLEFLQENQIEHSAEEVTELCFQYRYTMDYLQAFYQEELISGLVTAGIQVDVIGTGWENFIGIEKKQMVIHNEMNHQDNMRLIGNSKIVLNCLTWSKAGCSGCVLSAILNGALCITNDNKYLKEYFADKQSMICYDFEHLQQIVDDIIYYLKNNEEAEGIIQKAVDIVEKNHIWEKRVEEFLHILQKVAISSDSKALLLDLMIEKFSCLSEKEYVNIFEHVEVFLSRLAEDEQMSFTDEELVEIVGLLEESGRQGLYYHFITFLIDVTERGDLINQLQSHIIDDLSLVPSQKFNLYFWLIRFNFLNSQSFDEACHNKMRNLYSHILDLYRKELGQEYTYIPKEERNQNLVIATVGQFLGLTHGPTKTTLDRCEVLEMEMGKQTFIINTAEMFAPGGAGVPCYHAITPGYVDDLKDKQIIGYNGREYAYLQCDKNMPDINVIREIVSVVQEEKPYFILNIGGNSIVTDICSQIVPTISLSTVPSGMTTTRGQFQIIGRTITEEDKQSVQEMGLPEDHLIQTLFTSSFKEQTHVYTRQDFNLPEDAFIVLMVGGRLGQEIDREFEQLIDELMQQDIYFVFMGAYTDYEKVCERHSIFREYGFYLGFQEDALAVNELCDLYLNPKRVGGGTSVAEALYKGLPAVTLPLGDVGLGAGEEFHVKDYEEMKETILRYKSDKQFYAEKSVKAKERAARLTNSKGEFMKAIRQAENSIHF